METQQATQAAAGAETFESLFGELEDSLDVRVGAVLDALVVEFDGNRVVVDAGLKSRSQINIEEFRNDSGEVTIKPSETVKVKVEQIDDGRGHTVLSHMHYRQELAWKRLVEAYRNKEVIEGVVRERIKGGYSVHIDGLRAFLPGSLVDLFPVKQDTALIGKQERFYVERLKEERLSAILNRRLVREEELTGGDLSNLPFKVGDVVKGAVAAVVDYPDFTAYLRVGEGIHGMLSRDNFSWHRVGNLSEHLQPDQELDVKVLAIDTEKNRVILGAKQLEPDPWEDLMLTHAVGSKLYAKVSSIKEYGAFVEIEKGIDGLVHTSEMDWLKKNVQPTQILEVGQEIEVMILSYDKEGRRISLGLKQCKPNPWEEFQVSYAKGSRVTGTVSGSKNDLGLFVDLPGGISGLVHLSNLSHSREGEKEAIERYEKGQEVEVVVLDVDVDSQRVSLGIKQLHKTFGKIREAYSERRSLQAKVSRVAERFAEVDLGDGISAILPISQICEEKIDVVSDRLKSGDEITVQVIEIKANDNVTVSMKAHKSSVGASKKAQTREAVRKYERQHKEEEEAKAQAHSFGSMVKATLKAGADSADSADKKGDGAVDAEASGAADEPESAKSRHGGEGATEAGAEGNPEKGRG